MAMSREDSQRMALQEAHEVGAQTHELLDPAVGKKRQVGRSHGRCAIGWELDLSFSC